MRTFTDTFLFTIDRISNHFGPITMLIDSILDRIAPKAAAAACWQNCGLGCGTIPCTSGGRAGYRQYCQWYVRGDDGGCYYSCTSYGSACLT